MSGPKTDGDMMNCCTPQGGSDLMNQYRYQIVNNIYTSSYDPSGLDSSACPLDRNGNSIYAAFPALGDQIANCRSSCLNGHPQDYSFELYNASNGGVLPIAERGVELYENYGLDVSIRNDSGKYNGKNRDKVSCITDLGRKVTLYGNVSFGIYYYDRSTSNSSTLGTTKAITMPGTDVYYVLTINPDSGDRYPYFGNYGVTFTYGGSDYVYIVGQMEDLAEVGYTIDGNSITYYISSYLLFNRVFGLDVGWLNPESLLMRDKNGNVLNSPGSDNQCEGWNFKTGEAAPLFPLPYTHSYFTDFSNIGNSAWNCANGYEGSGEPDVPLNCYAAGVKSAYVPPHMEITLINYLNFSYTSDGPTGTQSYGYDTVIRTEDSQYNNGTFPAFGTPSSQLPANTTAVTTNRNAVITVPPGTLQSIVVNVRQDDNFYFKYVSYSSGEFAPEIFLVPGIQNAAQFPKSLNPTGLIDKLGNSLQTIKSAQDLWSSANPYWSESYGVVELNSQYLPGQVLYGPQDFPPGPSMPRNINVNFDPDGSNPSCSEGILGFTSKTRNVKRKKGVMLNEREPTTAEKAGRLFKKIASRAMGTELALYNRYKFKGLLAAKKSLSVLGLATTTPTFPVGQYRIKSFNVINGVYSLEWLYALYYCAMTSRNSVQYDADTGEYTTPNCTPGSTGTYGPNTCGRECLLFRDDYTYKVPGSIACPADAAMSAYCGMRNLSLIYGTWQPTSNMFSNDCACITTQNFCPAEFNPLCSTDPSNTKSYVTAAMSQCLGSSICNYCNVQVNQVVAAIYGCTDHSTNSITNFGDVCGDADCEYSLTVVGPDGSTTYDGTDDGSGNSGSGTTTDPPPDNKKYILLVLLIIIIIIVAVVIIYVYKKYKSPSD